MHTERNLENRDPSFDNTGASDHEWRLFLLRPCSQIVGLLSRGLGRGRSSSAADGDAGGTSESGQEAAGLLHGPGCGGSQQGHVSQTGDVLEVARTQRPLEVFTERPLAREDYVALWMDAAVLQGTPFVSCMGPP